jgi:putative zinc finger protein
VNIMPSHDELDQLSAYIDGELDTVERSRVEAHLPTCAECRRTLDALRATMTDLATLPEATPTAQDSWAIRSAIARSRTPAKRWQRAAWAAGTVAAGLIAFVAITHAGGNGSGALNATAPNDSAALEGAATNVPVTTVAGNFDPQSAQARLLAVSGKVPPAAFPLTAGSPAGTPGSRSAVVPDATKGAAFDANSVPAERQPTAALDRCVRTVTRSTKQALTPLRYELVTFEKKPAFFLFFSTPDRVELWVMTRSTCEVLYFAETS